jgi:hypothetical protein
LPFIALSQVFRNSSDSSSSIGLDSNPKFGGLAHNPHQVVIQVPGAAGVSGGAAGGDSGGGAAAGGVAAGAAAAGGSADGTAGAGVVPSGIGAGVSAPGVVAAGVVSVEAGVVPGIGADPSAGVATGVC